MPPLRDTAQAMARENVMVKLLARGKGSGVEVEARGAHVCTVRDGRAVRLEMYLDPARALEAVGLPG